MLGGREGVRKKGEVVWTWKTEKLLGCLSTAHNRSFQGEPSFLESTTCIKCNNNYLIHLNWYFLLINEWSKSLYSWRNSSSFYHCKDGWITPEKQDGHRLKHSLHIMLKVKVSQSCSSNLMDCSPWNSPSQKTELGSLSLLQGLPNPEIKTRFPALQAYSLPVEPPGKPKNTGMGSLSLL